MEFDLRRCHSGIWSVAQLPFSAHIEQHRLGGHQLQLPLLPHLSCQERHHTWYHHPVTLPDNVCLSVCLCVCLCICTSRRHPHDIFMPDRGLIVRGSRSSCQFWCTTPSPSRKFQEDETGKQLYNCQRIAPLGYPQPQRHRPCSATNIKRKEAMASLPAHHRPTC